MLWEVKQFGVKVANWYSHTGLCLRKLTMSLVEMEADEKMVLAGIVRWDKEYACNF